MATSTSCTIIKSKRLEPRGVARRWPLLMALTLIVLLPSWPLPSSWRPQSRQALSPGSGGAGKYVLEASAMYLDQVGDISRVLSDFVDALLEKVSFLADIVIESSMEEECDGAKAENMCSSGVGGAEQQQSSSTETSTAATTAGSTSSRAAIRDLAYNRLREEQFDKLEYTNVGLFMNSLINSQQQVDEPKTGQDRTGAGGTSPHRSCKLFNLALNSRDLPVNEMELCCDTFSRCYETCGRVKLTCDLHFRECLKATCKQKYDYTNETVVLRHRHSRELDETALYEPLVANEDGTMVDDGNDDDDDSYYDESPRPKRALSEEALNKLQMKRLRDKYKACRLASKILVIGNLAFGCQRYKESQRFACGLAATPGAGSGDHAMATADERGHNGLPPTQPGNTIAASI